MTVAGIIAEYDPFHNGHAAHINATRRAGASHIVTVMSGNFTQRGEQALISKWDRTRMALQNGSDLVIELPFSWSVSSAERFAAGGVFLLKSLGCVDMISFGSECADIALLRHTAAILDSPSFSDHLHQILRTGISYPAAIQRAAELSGVENSKLFNNPNDILAMEYIRSAYRYGYTPKFLAIPRQETTHDSVTHGERIASAKLIRQWIREDKAEKAVDYMPADSFAILKGSMQEGHAPASLTALDPVLLAKLRQMNLSEMAEIPGISEGLENRLYRFSRRAATVSELIEQIKTKRYPASRLRRLFCHVMLSDMTEKEPPYIRILGMDQRGKEILSAAAPTLPILTRFRQLPHLNEKVNRIFNDECRASDLYGLTLPRPTPCGKDLTTPVFSTFY